MNKREMDRVLEILKHSILNRLSSSNPFFQGSGIYVEEMTERLQKPNAMHNINKTVFSKNNRTDTHMNSLRLRHHAQDLQCSSQTKFHHGESKVGTKFHVLPRRFLHLIPGGRGKISFSEYRWREQQETKEIVPFTSSFVNR